VRVPAKLAELAPARAGRLVVPVERATPDAELRAAADAANGVELPVEWALFADDPEPEVDRALAAGARDALFSVESRRPVHAVRRLVARLAQKGAGDAPVVLRHRSDPTRDAETALLEAAVDLGAPLCDGIGDVVVLAGFGDPGRSVALAYRILQGARLRTTWTEFISCPSCGRTLFDLEETTARIKARTEHLRGVKIAIMGCIVNGPGEMADADFGYVGSGPGTVNLYVGKELVERAHPRPRPLARPPRPRRGTFSAKGDVLGNRTKGTLLIGGGRTVPSPWVLDNVPFGRRGGRRGTFLAAGRTGHSCSPHRR